MEMVMLYEAQKDASEEEQTQLLEELWSLQYRSPGVLTAAAGTLNPVSTSSHAAPSVAAAVSGFSHAVHWRLGNAASAQRLAKLPMVAEPTQAYPTCARATVFQFEGSVESDVEALFRRTSDFAEGIDHILLLRGTSEASASEGPESPATKLLQQVAVLAQSSLAGAVQVSYGKLVTAPAGLQDPGPWYVLMSRFASPEQLAAFKSTPPIRALWQGAGAQLPLSAHAQIEVVVAPSDSTRSSMSPGL